LGTGGKGGKGTPFSPWEKKIIESSRNPFLPKERKMGRKPS